MYEIGFEVTIGINNNMKHLHHIIPRHAGGTDDPSNLVELTTEEHAEAHRKLYAEHGRWQDFCAWQALSKRIGQEEILRYKQGMANKGRKRTPEQLERIREAARKRNERLMSDPVKWAEINAKRSKTHKGKKKSTEHMANWTAARKGHPVSKETRDKIRKTLAETRAKKL